MAAPRALRLALSEAERGELEARLRRWKVGRSQGLDIPGDLNENLMIGTVDATDGVFFIGAAAGRHFHPNLWADRPAELRPLYDAYFWSMGALAEQLMAIFASALNLAEAFFGNKIDRRISRLRVRNYRAPLVPPPGQLRVGAHADYGSR